jgi:hypothetical protein
VKLRLRTVVVLLFTVVFARMGNSCAYEPDEDVFARHTDPDAPYAKYAAGRLGIVQGTYRIRHLVIAYNTLSGRGLSPAEQSAAEAVENHYTTYPVQTPANTDQTWGPVSGSNERAVPGQNYETFTNCLADAFNNASTSLADRRARYGKPGAADTPEIADWIAAQRAVFSNCSGPGEIPQPVPANAPHWLRQDRAYQIAAAQFYALDYEDALAGFRAISADPTSPWAPLARYLVARVLIRTATVPYRRSVNPQENKDETAKVDATLAQAQAQLEGILRDPSMKPLYGQSHRLLDYVMLRIHPMEQAGELARRLTVGRPADDPDYWQNVIDLSFIYNSLPGYTPSLDLNDAQAALQAHPPSPLIRWLDDLGRPLPRVHAGASNSGALAHRADAVAAWQSTRGPEWLVAALTLSSAGQQGSAELMAAARNLSPSSPAYASATYHRLRLAASSPTTRPVYDELSQLMPLIVESQPLSTVNQFADLQSSLSPTLEDYLQNATRRTVNLVNPVSGDIQPPPLQNIALCGVNIHAPETRHLSDQTALIFNQRMPLRLLKEAALSSALPANVRFAVAHMAWTRALLLDDAETARSLSPDLAQCQPAFADWLNQYSAARTPQGRHVLGLLALMRFASTEPTVRAQLERDFAAYDGMRDNWWCDYNPLAPDAGPADDTSTHLFGTVMVAIAVQPDPPFLTAADRAQAQEEITRLQKIPSASDYFAQQALTWVKDHPTDAHDAEVIGFAMRVVRNACRSDKTGDLNHQLFDLLHRRFPSSEWATRYTTWE